MEGLELIGRADNKRIGFYEREFYVFSNFSAFAVRFGEESFGPLLYPTSEHAYHAQKFPSLALRAKISTAKSAHDSLKLAREFEKAGLRRPDWDDVKLDIMEQILRAKVEQHPYVLKKLIDSGTKELVEDSWRDDYWGWGPDGTGQNMLGKLWMKIRADYL